MDEREEGPAAAPDQIRGVDIDEAAALAHVMRPDNLLGVSSDQGREGAPADDVARQPTPGPGPVPAPAVYSFDAAGFIQDLKGPLTGNVAGYQIGLNENGSTIGLASRTGRRSHRTAARPGHRIPGCTSRA